MREWVIRGEEIEKKSKAFDSTRELTLIIDIDALKIVLLNERSVGLGDASSVDA